MAEREHSGFRWVNLNKPELRPVQLPMTRVQFDRLVGIAMSLDLEIRNRYKVGDQTFVYAMIRDIADGKLLVVRPEPTGRQPEIGD